MPTVTVEPNEKYWRVIDPVEHVHGEDTGYEDWSDEEKEAADAYAETVQGAPTADAIGMDEEDLDPLTWDMVSPPNDPDLLARMATYFEGINPPDDSDLIMAKLRLLDVEQMVNAQLAAKAEARNP
jgi:hypothetical protein